MFSKYIGYYEYKDLFTYFFPSDGIQETFDNLIHNKRCAYFRKAREAIFFFLTWLKEKEKIEFVALPSWCCKLVSLSVTAAGLKPIIFDISTDSLKVNIDEIIENKEKFNIKVFIAVANNGILYEDYEIKKLKDNGIFVIGDLAIALQNIDMIDVDIYDALIFSGGISKPISGINLGLLYSNIETDYNIPVSKIEPFEILKVIFFLILQNEFIYEIFSNYRFRDSLNYNGEIRSGSKNSLQVFHNSFVRVNYLKNKWHELQNSIIDIFQKNNIDSPLLTYSKYLQPKVIFNKKSLKSSNKYKIHFHRQYLGEEMLDDDNIFKIDSNYENTRKIINEYMSFTINRSVIKAKEQFISILIHYLVNIN